ncbi:SUMF1/EgtB/PvdO family nonheme iron enzyme [bacterium]|nr:SUMF1/EgtB/PvdO family nonheme iron enzyme [bacterium]
MKWFSTALLAIVFIALIIGCSKKDDNENEGSAPSVSITYPSDGDTIVFPQTISADISDDGTIEKVIFIAAEETIDVDTDTPYEAVWSFCSEIGNVILKVAAIDDEGNEGTAQITVYVPPQDYDFPLTAPAKSSHNIYLAWHRTEASLFYKYSVYMSEGSSVDETSLLADELTNQYDTTLLVDNLSPTTQYSFIVYSYHLSGDTLKSNVLTTNTEEIPSTSDDGAELITISSGDFTMGDVWLVGGNEETPARRVTLSTYKIYKYEVTCGQFKQFMDADGYFDPEWWDSAGWMWKEENSITSPMTWNDPDYPCGDAFPDYPVSGVSWYEANAYANFVGRRLPSEAQWECAARGRGGEDENGDSFTDGFQFPWGNDFFEGDTFHCNYESQADGGEPDGFDDGYRETSPVGTYPNGASPFGVMDMAGNVLEWCSDWYDPLYYGGAPNIDPEGPSTGDEKSLRGGAIIYDSGGAIDGYNLRNTRRYSKQPETRRDFIGFRLVEQ